MNMCDVVLTRQLDISFDQENMNLRFSFTDILLVGMRIYLP